MEFSYTFTLTLRPSFPLSLSVSPSRILHRGRALSLSIHMCLVWASKSQINYTFDMIKSIIRMKLIEVQVLQSVFFISALTSNRNGQSAI